MDADEHAGRHGRSERAPRPAAVRRAGSPSPAEPGHPLHPELEKADGHAAHGRRGAAPGHDRHAGHSPELFRTRFWLSLALTIPTVLYGHMLPSAIRWAPPAFPGSHLVAPVLGTAVFLYGGRAFLAGAWRELAVVRPGMMTLVALAITVAFGFSAAVTLGFPGMPL